MSLRRGSGEDQLESLDSKDLKKIVDNLKERLDRGEWNKLLSEIERKGGSPSKADLEKVINNLKLQLDSITSPKKGEKDFSERQVALRETLEKSVGASKVRNHGGQLIVDIGTAIDLRDIALWAKHLSEGPIAGVLREAEATKVKAEREAEEKAERESKEKAEREQREKVEREVKVKAQEEAESKKRQDAALATLLKAVEGGPGAQSPSASPRSSVAVATVFAHGSSEKKLGFKEASDDLMGLVEQMPQKFETTKHAIKGVIAKGAKFFKMKAPEKFEHGEDIKKLVQELRGFDSIADEKERFQKRIHLLIEYFDKRRSQYNVENRKKADKSPKSSPELSRQASEEKKSSPGQEEKEYAEAAARKFAAKLNAEPEGHDSARMPVILLQEMVIKYSDKMVAKDRDHILRFLMEFDKDKQQYKGRVNDPGYFTPSITFDKQ